jgi:hypothetical protein
MWHDRLRKLLPALAVTAWIVMFLGITVRLNVAPPGKHNLYPTFALAARHWVAGEDLYRTVDDRSQPDVYRYSPAVAPCFVPLTFLPDLVSSVLWRLINGLVFLGAIAWWLHRAGSPTVKSQAGLVFLLMMPLAVGSFNNGQSNPLVVGLLLAAIAAATGRGWVIAAVCLTGAVLFKVYPISLALLLVLVLPSAFARVLGVALLLGAVLPFLLQHPTYVMEQYQAWFGYIRADDRSEFPIPIASRDLRLLFRVWLWPLSSNMYVAIQLIAAAAAAGLCLLARYEGWPQARLLNLALGLGGTWMTVFGVAAESSTYILLAPSLVMLLVEVWSKHRPTGSMITPPPNPPPPKGEGGYARGEDLCGVETPFWLPLSRWGRGLGGGVTGRYRVISFPVPRLQTIRILALISFVLLTATQFANWYAPFRQAFHGLGPHPLAGLLFLAALLMNEHRWYASSISTDQARALSFSDAS